MQRRLRFAGLVGGTALSVLAAVVPAGAQGVPVIDPQRLAVEGLALVEAGRLTTQQEEKTRKRDAQIEERDAQLAAANETLELLTQASTFVPDLEGAGSSSSGLSLSAVEIYAIDDNNPYAERLFGDAPVTIEMMIAETAMRYSSHPALARSGINSVEFRAWFQALIKQESNFSIGARSHKAAFGLTQIIPGTAQELGIYPAYYEDPRLQLDGGARYLLQQLNRFGTMPLALAAYNAGPGAVQNHGGIPPYRETQDYVQKVTGYYNRYASRIEGIDAVGTLDPRDMVIAEASNIADAGISYAGASMETMHGAMTRLRYIIARIEITSSIKEAYDLNTYARAEVTRMAAILTRLQAANRKVEAARYALLLQAYAKDETYLNVRLDQ